jgi:hypothetical protein
MRYGCWLVVLLLVLVAVLAVLAVVAAYGGGREVGREGGTAEEVTKLFCAWPPFALECCPANLGGAGVWHRRRAAPQRSQLIKNKSTGGHVNLIWLSRIP